MGEAPFRMKPARSASEAGNRVFQTFGEIAHSISETSWGDFAVGVKDARGFDSVRVVEKQRSNEGRGRDSSMGTWNTNRPSMIERMARPSYGAPSMEVGNITFTDSPSGRKPEVSLEERGEDYLLQALDQLGGRLLKIDSALAMEAADLRNRIQACLKGCERERKAAAKAECDKLTEQGREALATLRKLEGERSMTEDDRNRAITKLNGAKQRLQAVKQGRPHDSEFPSEQEMDDWQAKYDSAKADADELQRQVDELRDEYRRQGAGVSLARLEVNRIRGERNAARQRAGIASPSEAKDEMEESLRAV